MKAELAKIKQENAEMHHREAFKIAAARVSSNPNMQFLEQNMQLIEVFCHFDLSVETS